MPFCTKCGAQVPAGAEFCPSCGSPMTATGQSSPGAIPVSGWSTLSKDAKAQEYWVKRLFAFVIDAIVVNLVIGLAVAATVLPSFIAGVLIPGYSPPSSPFGAFFGTFTSLLLVLYFTVAEATYGKTIGKRVLGLHVAAQGGGRPTLGASFLRNLSKINWVLLLLDVILGLALEAGYMKKFSDRYLGTSVVQD